MKKGEECQVLVERYLKEGDKTALDELVEKIDGMIKSLVKKYISGMEPEELYQVAWLTIMKCLKGYKLDSGVLFTSYCYTAIKREFRQYKDRQNKHKSKYDADGNCIVGFISLDSYISSSCANGEPVKTVELLEDDTKNTERETIFNNLVPVVYEIANSYENDKQRNILKYYLEGKKQNWIAGELDVSCGYVSKTVRLFNKKCAKELNK